MGEYYDHTFSPVAKFASVRAAISIAASKGMTFTHFDASTAILCDTLEAEIYVKQLEGFKDKRDKFCLLKKGLYERIYWV